MRTLGAILLPLTLLVALGGCGSYWGDPGAPPLPGERKPVLLLEEGLVPDERLAGLTVTLPPPVRNPDWPQAGAVASHAPGHLELGSGLRLAWQQGVGAGSGTRTRLLAAPVVIGGRIYVVDSEGAVSALAAGDGRRLWQVRPEDRETADRLAGGTLAASEDLVFVSFAHGDVVALAASDGATRWRTRVASPIRSGPSLAYGLVLVATADNQLLALAEETGEVVWRHAGTFEPAGLLGDASPAVDRRIVVVTYSSGEVFALEFDSGRPLWSDVVLRPRRTIALGSVTDIVGDPVIIGDRVVVAGNSGEMAAFDLARGARLWDQRLSTQQTPWAAGEFLFVVTDRGELACLLLQGGRVRWATTLEDGANDGARTQWLGPILAGGRLILVSSRSELVEVAPVDGTILARQPVSGSVQLPPVVADGTLYLLTEDATLLAYR